MSLALPSQKLGTQRLMRFFFSQGYVISNSLMEHVFNTHAEQTAKYAETLYEKDCCGDFTLAKVIYNTPGVSLQAPEPWSNGLFTKHPPHKVKFTAANLCLPVMSFHHLTDETPRVHAFEKKYADRRGDQNQVFRLVSSRPPLEVQLTRLH